MIMPPSTSALTFLRLTIFGGSAASALIGCASLPPPPTSTTTTFIEYVKAYQDSQLAVIDKLLTRNNFQQRDGYMSDALTWCMSGEELDKYENAITAYCKNKGGEMTQSDFCLDASGQAIFMAKASILDRCYPATHKALVETKIIESTQPTPTPSYLRELSNYGFKSKTHLAAEEAYYQAMDLASQEKHQNDLPLITRIGTSVCTNQEGKIIYGWVEDYVEPNLKIRVYGWGTMHSHNILAYPSAKIIWTHHSNWNLCN